VCGACAKVLGLAHPDLHWFVPVARPKAGEPEKQGDEVAELLEAAMADRRQHPIWTPPDGMSLHGMATARLLQRAASLTPVEGGWRVFIIGHADRLVPQESSPDAANALLKLLEEPPARSIFVLTTLEPGLVLPTIRSRAMPVRLGRLPDATVRDFVRSAKPEAATDELIAAANGSIGVALSASGEARLKARASAAAFLDAIEAADSSVIERVLRQPAFQARGDFTAMLDALLEMLSERSRSVVGSGSHVSPRGGTVDLWAIERVTEARQKAQGNVNPQLLLAVLADELSAPVAA
jgi:DNA polymerase-3 subunit delta'